MDKNNPLKIIELEKLDVYFEDKPIVIGGMAMEYYGTRKHGDDVDNPSSPKYINNEYNIALYTFNQEEKIWYWAGQLEKVEVITYEKAMEVYNIYKQRGWFEEMKNDIYLVNGNIIVEDIYHNVKFNMRFKKENIVNRFLTKFDENEKVKTSRVEFMDINRGLSIGNSPIKIIENDDDENNDFDEGKIDRIKRRTIESEKEYENRHKKIQKSFFFT